MLGNSTHLGVRRSKANLGLDRDLSDQISLLPWRKDLQVLCTSLTAHSTFYSRLKRRGRYTVAGGGLSKAWSVFDAYFRVFNVGFRISSYG